MEKSEPSDICYWECKLVEPLWKRVCRFQKKLKIELLYESAITLLSVFSIELKISFQTKTCTEIFIVALFSIAKMWKQHKCSSADECINKMWFIHKMEYYSVI